MQLDASRLSAGSPGQASPARRRTAATVLLDAAVFLVLAAAAALMLASCSGPGPVPPPARSSLTQAAAAALSAFPAAQVIAAYTAYFPVLTAAETQPQARAAAMLAPYAAQPYLGHVLAQMAGYRARDEVAWGYLTPHVTAVQVSGSQAIVRDCQDASNAWLVSSATGQVIPGTTGSARTSLIAGLARGSGGQWHLTFLAHLAGPCSPVPSPS